jgi:tight adherence protein C
MVAVLAILLFLTFFTALFGFGAAYLAPSSVLGIRLRALLPRQQAEPAKPVQERIEQALDPVSKLMPKSPDEVSETVAWLMQAGYREERHATIYWGIRGLTVVAFFLVTLISGLGTKAPMLLIVMPLLGFMLPRFVLKRMIKRRQNTLRLALPDALDLLVICVEAGLSLDQALARVGADLEFAHPELSDELQLVGLEMRAGKPRVETLRNLASRTGVDDIRALVAVLIQTDRFGTSIAQALRVHSDSLRTERRQRAEEAAAKTTIKMVPVLVFFILPAMFVVTLGPAAIQMIRTLGPIMHGQR